jgi:hypothetical protein
MRKQINDLLYQWLQLAIKGNVKCAYDHNFEFYCSLCNYRVTRNHVMYTSDNLVVLSHRIFYITLKEVTEDMVAKGADTNCPRLRYIFDYKIRTW